MVFRTSSTVIVTDAPPEPEVSPVPMPNPPTGLMLANPVVWLLLDDPERLTAYRFARVHADCVLTLHRSLSTGGIHIRCHSCQSNREIRKEVKR